MDFTQPTPIANSTHPTIKTLIHKRRWDQLTNTKDRIGAAYNFVKDEIAFGYNASDDLAASAVLHDGYGQCNTKGNLLVALLRALDIPARFHGFRIDKRLQKGAIPAWMYPLAPRRILHSWVEVYHDDQWIPLEGFILDAQYLGALQRRFSNHQGTFCGYGVATKDLHQPDVQWTGQPTFIQKEGIVEDLGVFTNPDDLYAKVGTNLRGPKRWLYQKLFRHLMNHTVNTIRKTQTPRIEYKSTSTQETHP